MSEDKPHSNATAWIAVIVVLPILYVLSPGPVAAILIRSGPHGPPTWFKKVYAPLEKLEHTPAARPLEELMDWWVKLAQK